MKHACSGCCLLPVLSGYAFGVIVPKLKLGKSYTMKWFIPKIQLHKNWNLKATGTQSIFRTWVDERKILSI